MPICGILIDTVERSIFTEQPLTFSKKCHSRNNLIKLRIMPRLKLSDRRNPNDVKYFKFPNCILGLIDIFVS